MSQLGSRRATWLTVAALGVVAAIPVWIAPYPPMVDLPGHAAQITLLRELHNPSFPFAAWFELHWFTPYLLGYALMYSLTPLLGVVAACKTVVTLALVAVPIATALVIREMDGDPFWAVLVTPGLLGCVYCWGFLNFLVAAPLGLIFLWTWIRRLRSPTPAGSLWLALLVNLLFFCHALACGFFLIVSGAWMLARRISAGSAVRAAFPLIAVLPLMVQWVLNTGSHPYISPTVVGWDLKWFSPAAAHSMDGRIAGLFPSVFGLPRDAFSPSILLLLAAIAACAWIAGARPRRDVSAWVPFLVCVLCLLTVPLVVFGAMVVYPRFATFFLPFAAIAFAAPATATRWPRVVLVLLLVGWTAVIARRTLQFRSESAAFPALVAQMEPGQRALSLIIDRDSETQPTPVYLHFPAWYAATRSGLVDMSFALFGVEPVQYRYDVVPLAGVAFDWMPENFRWRNFKKERYRYFVVRTRTDPAPMFAVADCPVKLVYHEAEWWLFDAPASCYANEPQSRR